MNKLLAIGLLSGFTAFSATGLALLPQTYVYQCFEGSTNGFTPPSPAWISEKSIQSSFASGPLVKRNSYHDHSKNILAVISSFGAEQINVTTLDALTGNFIKTYTCTHAYKQN